MESANLHDEVSLTGVILQSLDYLQFLNKSLPSAAHNTKIYNIAG
jgi:hypothetical protein